MSKFTKIPADTFKKLQLNAGVLLSEFDPESAALKDSAIVAATSGGVKFSAVPTFKDFGEDIDNCPKNMLELKRLESWEVTISGSGVTVDAASAKTIVGVADVDKSDPTKVVPRNDVTKDDFEDLWWVGDYGDVDGGFLAIHMLNSLSTGGFSAQSSDKAKGAFEFTFTGHYSMAAQDTPPFELYVRPKVSAEAKEAKR